MHAVRGKGGGGGAGAAPGWSGEAEGGQTGLESWVYIGLSSVAVPVSVDRRELVLIKAPSQN